MLGDRNSPAYPEDAPILDDVPRGAADPGTSRQHVAAAGFRRRTPAVRPVQASFALVSSARNRADTISPPKCY